MIVWALALLPAALNAQVADTLKVENPSSVQIVSSPGTLSVSIDGTAENPEFHYSASVKADTGAETDSDRLNFETPFTKKRNLSHWKLTLMNSEEVGLFDGVIGGEDLFGNAKMREMSCDLGIIGVRYYPGLKNHYLSFGWHVGYSMTQRVDGNLRFSQDNGCLSLAAYPAGATENGGSSTISRLRYSFPLQYTFVFGKNLSWRAAAGTELHWNLVNRIQSQYLMNGNHVTEYINNIKPNPVSLDLMASLTCKGLGLRFRYCPTPAFTAPNGPAYRTWSIGFLVEY